MKPRLLDLFCGAGGCAMGYARAGFEVVGVDLAPQKHYPFEFIQADAMTYPLNGFDVVHASPPCQAYSIANNIHAYKHPALLEAVRQRLGEQSTPWVIENVFGARHALPGNILLCGVRFGLKVYRHRLFESSELLFSPGPCEHPPYLLPGYVSVFGGGAKSRQKGNRGNAYKRFPVSYTREAMGIDWMNRGELSQAIPPAYTEYIGRQLRAVLANTQAA